MDVTIHVKSGELQYYGSHLISPEQNWIMQVVLHFSRAFTKVLDKYVLLYLQRIPNNMQGRFVNAIGPQSSTSEENALEKCNTLASSNCALGLITYPLHLFHLTAVFSYEISSTILYYFPFFHPANNSCLYSARSLL